MGTLVGTSGCNAYAAGYLISGKKIAITPAVRTRLTYPEPVIMAQESAFLAVLPKAAFIQTGEPRFAFTFPRDAEKNTKTKNR
ncbi:MAG: META domain-containing protein [Methanomicrobiales archaeon]